MKRLAALAVLICFSLSAIVYAEQVTIPAQELRKPAFQYLEEKTKKERFFLSAWNEMSWVKQGGSKKGHWNFLSNQAYFSATDWLMPYVEFDVWNRYGNSDEIIIGGAYVKFKDGSYLRGEMGWGESVNYIYRWQSTLEYERRLYKGLSWNVTGRYLNYALNDVWIGSPGFRYYFKNHYVGAFYNISETVTRGTAHWGTLKGHFELTKRINVEAGTAIGERLYDIQTLRAAEEFGYILFANAEFKISKNLSVKAGYGYSQEKPSFIKRDLDFGVFLRF